MIIPIVLDTDLNRIGMIDDYSSLIWASRYYSCGDFEIVLPVDSSHFDIAKEKNYVMRDDDENVGIIEDIDMGKNEDQKEQIIIKGRFLPSILARRIIAQQTQLSGTISSGIGNLINDAIINPVIPERKIDNFKVIPSNFTERLDAQFTGKNLLTTIEDICQSSSIGFKVTLQNKIFIFSLYKGIDRSYGQEINPHVVFSDENDNLISSQYTLVSSSKITDVLVAGEGEGLDRKMLWVSKENLSGLDRYEVFHDQRNLSSNDGSITDDEYNYQMQEEGLEQITTVTQAFNGTVYFDNIKYREDVYLGDIVVIENKKWSVYINSRLIETIESVDETGTYSIVPTFGV